MQNQQVTAYPSIDKPWVKHYVNNKLEEVNASDSLYNNFKKITDRKQSELAFVDYNSGLKISYLELYNQIEAFANALSSIGITNKNKIGILSFNCVVEPIVLLAANKIGATVVFINPDGNPMDMAANIEYVDLLVLESVFLELEPIINKNKLSVIVYGQCTNMSSTRCIHYEEFIKKEISQIESHKPDKDTAALVIFSSGSTGIPKPIVHTNFTVNNAINKMLRSDFPINENNYLIKVIPSHIGLGVITTMLVGLLSGVPYIQLKGLPEPVTGLPKETFDLILNYKKWITNNDLDKNKGLILLAAPYFAKYLLSRADELKDMSMINGILLGGAKMHKEELEQMDSVFGEKGLKVPVCNGYGQNEMAGAVALNTVHNNVNGSAGYPVHGVDVKIVDRYTNEELPYNTIGKIIEQSDSKFLCYMGMPERTDATRVILADGSEWYDTTDLGYMDEDGFLFITGRTTRVIIKADHKISLDVIEEKIKSLESIKEVAVVPSKTEGEIIAFVIVDKMIRSERIIELLESNRILSPFEIPDKIEIVESLPRMNNGKLDYQRVIVLANEMCN